MHGRLAAASEPSDPEALLENRVETVSSVTDTFVILVPLQSQLWLQRLLPKPITYSIVIKQSLDPMHTSYQKST